MQSRGGRFEALRCETRRGEARRGEATQRSAGGAVNVEHRTSPGDGFFGDLTNEGERLLFNLRSPWYQPLLLPLSIHRSSRLTTVTVRFQLLLLHLPGSNTTAIYFSSSFHRARFHSFLFPVFPSTLLIHATTLEFPSMSLTYFPDTVVDFQTTRSNLSAANTTKGRRRRAARSCSVNHTHPSLDIPKPM